MDKIPLTADSDVYGLADEAERAEQLANEKALKQAKRLNKGLVAELRRRRFEADKLRHEIDSLEFQLKENLVEIDELKSELGL